MKCIIFTYCETGKLCYRKILQILVQRIFSAFEKALVCQNRSSRTKDIMKKANPSPFFPKILHFHGRKCSRIRKFSCFTVYVTIYYLNTICATSIHEFESLYTCGFGELQPIGQPQKRGLIRKFNGTAKITDFLCRVP